LTPAPALRGDRLVLVGVAVGGVAGTAVRDALVGAYPATSAGFPWLTFAINVAGAAALGLLLSRLGTARGSHRIRALLGTGFLGGFTTFSTFAVETDLLVHDGRAGVAAVYVVASLVVGTLAALTGTRLGRTLPGAPAIAAEADAVEGGDEP